LDLGFFNTTFQTTSYASPTRAGAGRSVAFPAKSDDFGRSPTVNASVIRAHREGLLTSASLMVTRFFRLGPEGVGVTRPGEARAGPGGKRGGGGLAFVRYLRWYAGHWKGPGADSKGENLPGPVDRLRPLT